jgi:hypothetical protein
MMEQRNAEIGILRIELAQRGSELELAEQEMARVVIAFGTEAGADATTPGPSGLSGCCAREPGGAP